MSAQALAEPKHTCRFYGCSNSALRLFNIQEPTYGNQCAAIMDAHAPCKMETLRKAPNETKCPIARGALNRGLGVQKQ
jgi:hypothetical protein